MTGQKIMSEFMADTESLETRALDMRCIENTKIIAVP